MPLQLQRSGCAPFWLSESRCRDDSEAPRTTGAERVFLQWRDWACGRQEFPARIHRLARIVRQEGQVVKGGNLGENYILKGFPITERMRLEELFPRHQNLEVELGAGDGSFLITYAKAHPELNLIGVERLFGRLR